VIGQIGRLPAIAPPVTSHPQGAGNQFDCRAAVFHHPRGGLLGLVAPAGGHVNLQHAQGHHDAENDRHKYLNQSEAAAGPSREVRNDSPAAPSRQMKTVFRHPGAHGNGLT
jgi:hypothetical protein